VVKAIGRFAATAARTSGSSTFIVSPVRNVRYWSVGFSWAMNTTSAASATGK
jgi:hypothetical protein